MRPGRLLRIVLVSAAALAIDTSGAVFVWAAADTGPSSIWFATSSPTVRQGRVPRVGFRILTRKEYDRQVRSDATFVPIRELAPEHRPLVGVGPGVTWGGKTRSYALYGRPDRGYAVYIDTNGDGSLRDEPPLEFDRASGHYSAVFTTEVTETSDAGDVVYPILVRFLVFPPTKHEGRTTAIVDPRTTRDGTIVVGDDRIAFRLWGRHGIYDHPTGPVWFDLDGDGHGYEDEASRERFFVRDGVVNIGGRSYRFAVDRFGRGLSLEGLESPVADHPSLDVGADAPAFSARDITGKVVGLAALRGRVVLLDFTAAWCGPCRADAPALASLHGRHRGEGFEVVAVGPDSEDEARRFDREFGVDWPHVCEAVDGPIHRVYRVIGYPTYFLVGRNGRIARAQVPSYELAAEIEKALK